jgi:RimJ/RimL family protein N-acetyltransferase
MRFPRDVPTLTDGVVTLRAHRVEDIPAVLGQGRDPEMAAWTRAPSPYGLEDARRFVTQAAPGGWADEVELFFAIETDGRFAGSCSLRDQGDRLAEIGYALHPSARRRGVMERALRLAVDWGFSRFDTLVWYAQVGNWASRKVAWRLGFTCSGPLPGYLPHRGELRDAWAGTLRAGDAREPRHAWYDAPRIVGDGVVLRPHVPADADRIVEACNDPRQRRWIRLPSPYTSASAREFMESRMESMATGTAVHWAVADPETDRLLGVVGLFDLQPGADAEVGYWTHPDTRGRGVATQACRLAVRHAFVPVEDGGLGLPRVTVCAAAGNAASRHVGESVGFRLYGVERRGIMLGDGSFDDLARYDLLAEELL